MSTRRLRRTSALVSVGLLLAAAVFLFWQWHDPARAWPVAIAVLVVSCPCALSLATPSALAAATDALLRRGAMLGIPFSYRDDRSLRGMALVEEQLPHAELFQRNGLQRIPLNTINQLVMDRESGLIDVADGFLHVPDLFGYWLTGRRVAERTIASTIRP